MKEITKVALAGIDQIGEVFERFPWENRESYCEWLAQTYFYATHTTRLLALASTRFDFDRQSLHQRFIEHAREEKSHDILLIKDLAHMDRKLEHFSEAPSTAALYQCQYYWIQHADPMSFFGFILLLEGVAAKYGTQACERATKAFGARGTTFWKVHSSEDPDHLEKAFKSIEGVSPEVEQQIIANFKVSIAMYEGLLETAIAAGKKSTSISKKSA